MKDCDGLGNGPKPLKRSYYSTEKAICTPFFLKISRKFCGFPKIHGDQPKSRITLELCRISKIKMQELRRKKLIDRRARVRARCGGGEGKECGEAENADWRAKKSIYAAQTML
ncbi:MAG: hypothetical protein KH197_09140 [Clostridiales bacterium]|nr:hypothetical protein [Clostridiales bacterium]